MHLRTQKAHAHIWLLFAVEIDVESAVRVSVQKRG